MTKILSLKEYGYARAEKKKEEGQDFSKIPGVPGHDYPIYHEFPHTSFDCGSVPAHPGIYANVETGCQVCKVCYMNSLWVGRMKVKSQVANEDEDFQSESLQRASAEIQNSST